ncbi:MAG TPA: peptide transporter [Thermotogota bacterium]|nr:peptide transporter [Thermotogota bacterium]HPJ88350.1 peptide transporter [Thermotogota bacterium]HPR95482.1 peptide transporter [Thermotogota bacterium]
MKDLIRLSDLSRRDIDHIFKMADRIDSFRDSLKGKTIVMFFPESSIRTRVTFEAGIHILGAQGILFPSTTLDKKEALKDVTGYLNNWSDCLIIRHRDIDLIREIAAYSKGPVINAMTSANHPCEILSDLYSLSKIRKNYLKDTYLFVGADGNIGESWKSASEILNLDLVQACPEGFEIEGLTVINDIKSAVKAKDIVLTDSVPSDYSAAFKPFQITKDIMRLANDGAILNPCPPFTRGAEVSQDVIASDFFAGYSFKRHLLSVQQAIILYMMGIK